MLLGQQPCLRRHGCCCKHVQLEPSPAWALLHYSFLICSWISMRKKKKKSSVKHNFSLTDIPLTVSPCWDHPTQAGQWLGRPSDNWAVIWEVSRTEMLMSRGVYTINNKLSCPGCQWWSCWETFGEYEIVLSLCAYWSLLHCVDEMWLLRSFVFRFHLGLSHSMTMAKTLTASSLCSVLFPLFSGYVKEQGGKMVYWVCFSFLAYKI